MSEVKKRINVYIPGELYVKVAQSDYTLTDAVVKGLEILLEPPRDEFKEGQKETIGLDVLRAKESHIQALEAQLKDKDSSYQDRITDLKEEITLIHDQLKEKDSQIKNLATITESQARSVKLIEAPGANKPWWKFW